VCSRYSRKDSPFLEGFQKNDTFLCCGNNASVSPAGPIRTDIGNVPIFIKCIRWSSGCSELGFRAADQPSTPKFQRMKKEFLKYNMKRFIGDAFDDLSQ
jgi:hypothetical protein